MQQDMCMCVHVYVSVCVSVLGAGGMWRGCISTFSLVSVHQTPQVLRQYNI